MSAISAASDLGVVATVRRGLQLSPAMTEGIVTTLLLAVVATAGRVVVPVVLQQATDHGILADGGPDVARVAWLAVAGLVVLLLTGQVSAAVNVRLYRTSERGLAQLRVATFRHVHDLSTLTQSAEKRGSLVSRVTSDVDTVSLFVQRGGLMLVLNAGQLLLAGAAMLVYSWQLALLVWVCFLPMVLLAPRAQKRVSAAYGRVRVRVGAMLSAISESVVGAETIRAFGAAGRTQRRIDAAVREHREEAVRAQTYVAIAFSTGVVLAAVALAAVVVAGTYLGAAGDLTIGEVLAFLFLVQMFTGPVQNATEMLNELQNAVAGWRRVIAVLETPVDVTDPADPLPPRSRHATRPAPGDAPTPGVVHESAGAPAVPAPDGAHRAARVEFRGVRYAYPGGPEVLHGVDLAIEPGTQVAVVGRTGSGKTTLAKLLVRLMDPTAGEVLLDGADLRRLTLRDLRSRVVLVPQEGFLLDASIGENIAYGAVDHPAEEVEAAVAALGLDGWVASLPAGLDTPVGQRGESLSAGERQLVALARASLADADLLVLDEATSAVDPATETRIARALDRLTAGRTSVTIAHRLSTAEAADLVVVVEDGHLAGVGSHEALLAAGGPYARMHASWVAQTR
ncbi:ABC transporter ATP-binding protein [Georgenia muralis]|uniref:ABC-type multidrug transport system fused ATPase/permease subunit n=1 Tax=Georgenia muralis TaxID=154117 RepID=A0A3N5A458_9MICO|nr:ABC transporter ATP-binding protein [Georgenia muralis]RPF28145.1 ABC-type multidrug transport system fused ATPase/permease subunit [Georgenia muralis]